MATEATKARFKAKGVGLRPTRAQRRAAFDKQIGHKATAPKGKGAKK